MLAGKLSVYEQQQQPKPTSRKKTVTAGGLL